MRRASLTRAALAVVAVFVAVTAAATPASPATAEASVVPIIPVPASISPRAGSFIVRPGTPIYTSGDAEAARIAAYFAALLQRTHAIALAVRRLPAPRAPAAVTPETALPAPAIVFRLDPQAPGTSPESYQIDVSPQRVLVSARDYHGLFYGAVTLWASAACRPAAESSRSPRPTSRTLRGFAGAG